MADITMCINNECYFREDCYRYTAIRGMRQSISCFKPTQIEDSSDCTMFYKNYSKLSIDELAEVDKRNAKSIRWLKENVK